jgi:N-acetylmuramic acid 6-phosphate etherase
MTDAEKGTGLILGIEGGGTRTVALLADGQGKLVQRLEAGPANVRLLSDTQLRRHLRLIGKSLPKPAAVAIGLAGAREERDRQRIRDAASAVWPGVRCVATHDLETALATAPELKGGTAEARVLVLSGTGSCCYGRTRRGKVVKFGGWGHLLGDKGSGYEIGLRALKAVVYYLDCDGEWSRLGQRILRVLQLNEPNELIGWVQQAGKAEIAALATEVFAAWEAGDEIATDILTGAAHSLAKDAVKCAQRLVKKGAPVQFVLAGSILLKQPKFAKAVCRQLKKSWPNARFSPLERESAWGAVELARQECAGSGKGVLKPGVKPAAAPAAAVLSPTELRNPASLRLDRLRLGEAIELMLQEDASLSAAVLRERAGIEQVLKAVIRAFKRGGRLFYVGAGTSGRLGILDASECPPTFRTPPEMVQAIIAGGQRAIWQAVEGAEDDAGAGARAVAYRGVTGKDVVVGIAASGRTPFVWGALEAAKALGAATALVCFNPAMKAERRRGADVIIAPEVGPEVLTGSTRLKSGTATKLILNIFTTLAMVKMGKVVSNLMVDLNPSNIKLRDRAVRIVQELTGEEPRVVKAALEASGWVVKAAWRKLQGRSQERLKAKG